MSISQLNSGIGFAMPGIDFNGTLGTSVSGAGDVNDDGIPDFVVGVPTAVWNGAALAGRAYVVFGRSGLGSLGSLDLASLDGSNGFVINGIAQNEHMGLCLTGGDLNGDGIADLALGAPYATVNGHSTAGKVYVLFGRSGLGGAGSISLASLDGINGFSINGINGSNNTGLSVDISRDVNGDGIGDLVIGAPGASPHGQSLAGQAYVLFGNSNLGAGGEFNLSSLNGANGLILNGMNAGDRAGFAVSGAGDVNGDHIDDILIGAFDADPDGRTDAGVTYVVFGGYTIGSGGSLALSSLNGSNGFVAKGINPGDEAGGAVHAAGDVNRDGFDDFLIGATEADPNGQLDAGESYLVFGSPTLGASGSLELSSLNGSTGFKINGIGVNDAAGFSVSAAGDLNHDGTADLAVGAILADPESFSDAGQVYVILGGNSVGGSGVINLSALNGADGFTVNGVDTGGFVGSSVANAGDINNDGKDDLLIGGKFVDPSFGLFNAGTVYVLFGRPHSADCNGNGVPDECDIASCSGSVACQDCNGNGTPDYCDIASGESLDCNLNGEPDECEAIATVVASEWRGGVSCNVLPTRECWSSSENWCPGSVPDNTTGRTFEVTVSPSLSVTLDISPTISTLIIDTGAVLEVDDSSGANVRTLAIDGMTNSSGIIRATDRERLVLDAPAIDQTGGGILEATDGAFDGGGTQDQPTDKSILEINGAVVTGGIARTIGTNSEIHLIGGAELVNVDIQGVVVPDGQAGAFGGIITNSGDLRVAPSGLLITLLTPIGTDGVLQGNGGNDDRVHLGGQTSARLGNFTSSFTNASSHKIDGAGFIFGGFTNDGTVQANISGQHLVLSPPGDKTNNGTMQAIGDGVLRIADDVGGNGSLLTEGGTILVVSGVAVVCDDIDVPPGSVSHLDIGVNPAGPATVSASTLSISGGIVTINNGSTVNISGIVTICPALSLPSAVAELHVNQSTLNAESLDVCPGGVLTVASTLSLGDSFRNAMTDGSSTPAPAHWSWAPGSDLVFTGGQQASEDPFVLDGWAKLEAASVDAGPAGGANNFNFADVLLTAGSHVSLIDNNENHVPAVVSEAVYCDTLTLSAGAALNLNGLKFYVGGVQLFAGAFGMGHIIDSAGIFVEQGKIPAPPGPSPEGVIGDVPVAIPLTNPDQCGLCAPGVATAMSLIASLLAIARGRHNSRPRRHVDTARRLLLRRRPARP
jgi:hypothetical protein